MVTDAELREFLRQTHEVFLQELFDYIEQNAELNNVSQERLSIQIRNMFGSGMAEEWRFHSGYGH